MKNKKIVFVIIVLIAGAMLLLGTKAEAISEMTEIEGTIIEGEKARLTWNEVSGAAGYEVHVDIPGMGYTYIGSVTKNKATIKGFTKGMLYKAKIRAFETVNGKKEYSDYSNEIPIEIEIEGLEKVENFTAEVEEKKAKLKWDKVENANEYEVYVNVPGKGYVYLGSATGLGGSITGFTENADYYIKVRAANSNGAVKKYGEYSEEKLVRIERKVSELKFIEQPYLTELTDKQIEIVAKAEGENLTYTVEYGKTRNYGQTKIAAGVSGENTNIKITGLENYTEYYYKISVSDGTNTIVGETGMFMTKCGLGTYCDGTGAVCEVCKGIGYLKATEETCETCRRFRNA